jgi:hypothetical protein
MASSGCAARTDIPRSGTGPQLPNREEIITRRRILADFGEFALRSDDLDDDLTEACRLVGDAPRTDLSTVLKIVENENVLLVRAGVGWQPGIVRHERFPLGERSSETCIAKAGAPVLSMTSTTRTASSSPSS